MPISQAQFVMDALWGLDPKTVTIIAGGAPGADSLANLAAVKLGLPIIVFKAEWDKYGKSAGPIRNQQMLDQKPDLVVAFHSTLGITPGTLDMVTRAQRAGVPVKILTYEPEND